jgi:hypothetical protein
MKIRGTFNAVLRKNQETDGGCSYPKVISPDFDDRVISVRTDKGGSMACWTMMTYEYELLEPKKGDCFIFQLPCSRAEGLILNVEDQGDQWLIEVDGEIDGAYKSIEDGNPVCGLIIPENELVLSSETDHLISFGEYRRRRIIKSWGTIGKYAESLLDVNPGQNLSQLMSDLELGWLHEEQEAEAPVHSEWFNTLPFQAPAWAC